MRNHHTPNIRKCLFILRLLVCWLRFPHLRLGQLIDGAVYPIDLFYITDERLLLELETFPHGEST